MANTTYNIWDQARNTARIRMSAQTVLETQARPARMLSTMVPTQDDKIVMERMHVAAAGLAPYKAIGATPVIYAPRFKFVENAIELIQISEMYPIDERKYRLLSSPDPRLAERAGLDIQLADRNMAIRNENRSDLMTMTAILTGALTIGFEDELDQGLTISYDYPAGHTLVNATDWNVPSTATPITDIRAVQQLLADDAGDYGIHIWMNTETYQDLIWADQTKSLLTGTERAQFIPENADINKRLLEGARVQWHVTSAGYRAENSYARGRSAITKWIPDNRVIMTTEDPFEGEPLVEMFDGMVLVRTGFDTRTLRQGNQTYAKIDDSDTLYNVNTSTRMPRINRPECIAIMDVGP